MTVANLSASSCVVCNRPLTDPESIAAGIGSDCRANFGYSLAHLAPEYRVEANRIIHAIAAEVLVGTPLRDALFRLHSLGFAKLAQRIERRVWRRAMPQQMALTIPAAAPAMLGKLDLPFELTEGQERAREAVQRTMAARGHSRCFIVGYSGVGKTTALKIFAQEHGLPQIITPTGRAALRVKEATGLEASTIHRWLYKPKENEKTGAVSFVRRAPEDIAVPHSRMILLDEASMVGPDIWQDVISVCQQMDLKLVCVGDGFQLPPVQAPNAPPFSILTPQFAAQLGAERVEMTEVLRQAQGSPVIRASMALRAGGGINALRELPKIETSNLANATVKTHLAGGVTACHRNVTRLQLNAGIRMMLGVHDEMPQVGEPMVVLKNTYEAGVVNGECISFEGWEIAPDGFERVHDKYKNVEESTRFGSTRIGGGKVQVVISLEELHGRLTAGPRAIEIAASKWARLNNLYSGETLAPLIHVNFGYAWTVHKLQGHEIPYVLVCVEPSVRLDEEEGRRWLYTAITRSTKMTAIHFGRV